MQLTLTQKQELVKGLCDNLAHSVISQLSETPEDWGNVNGQA